MPSSKYTSCTLVDQGELQHALNSRQPHLFSTAPARAALSCRRVQTQSTLPTKPVPPELGLTLFSERIYVGVDDLHKGLPLEASYQVPRTVQADQGELYPTGTRGRSVRSRSLLTKQ